MKNEKQMAENNQNQNTEKGVSEMNQKINAENQFGTFEDFETAFNEFIDHEFGKVRFDLKDRSFSWGGQCNTGQIAVLTADEFDIWSWKSNSDPDSEENGEDSVLYREIWPDILDNLEDYFKENGIEILEDGDGDGDEPESEKSKINYEDSEITNNNLIFEIADFENFKESVAQLIKHNDGIVRFHTVRRHFEWALEIDEFTIKVLDLEDFSNYEIKEIIKNEKLNEIYNDIIVNLYFYYNSPTDSPEHVVDRAINEVADFFTECYENKISF